MNATINAEQRRILVRYAAGEELPDIAKATGIDGDLVNATVTGPLVRFDRRRATELVRAYDRTNGQAELARQMTSAQRQPAAKANGEGLLATVTPTSTNTHIYALLDEAEATGDRYLVVRVHKVRALLDEIRDRIAEAREVQAARDEVARLEAELAAARARLKGGRAAPVSPAPPAAEEAGPTSATLRAWAAERGIECPDRGRVPSHIRDAWNAEHGSVAA